MRYPLLSGGIVYTDGSLQDRHPLPVGSGQDLYLVLEALAVGGDV